MINAAAKRRLEPIGAVQKGRSRLWLLDRSWFLILVEFQPSGFTRGSYLNVYAHFLWNRNAELSFDVGKRCNGFIEYESDAQFFDAADELARAAAHEAIELEKSLKSPSDAVQMLNASSTSPGWPEYHSAIALGVDGRTTEAARFFELLLSDPNQHRDWEKARARECREFLRLLPEADDFRVCIINRINDSREHLKLAVVGDPLLPPNKSLERMREE